MGKRCPCGRKSVRAYFREGKFPRRRAAKDVRGTGKSASFVDMDTAARVLLIGNAEAHLETRAAVLRSFWQVATLSAEAGELPPLDTDLVVVCETLPELERQQWVERVRLESSAMLVVKLNGYDAGPHAGADATVDVEHGPGALVATIYELLTERGLESRSWPFAPRDVPVN